MPYLTSPQAQQTERTYRYFVELASLELDFEGVPLRHQIVDAVVVKPTEAALASLIAAAGWLEGYKIVAHWTPQPDDCNCF